MSIETDLNRLRTQDWGYTKGLVVKGKSVQSGTPTPESPVPIQSVAHNTSITSCGKNLANWKRNWYDASYGATSTSFRNEYDSVANCLNIKTNNVRAYSPGILVRVKPNTNYTFSAKLVGVIDTNRVRLAVYKKGTGEYYDIVVKQSDYTSLIIGDVYNLEFDSGDTDIIMLVVAGNSGLLPGQILCKCDDIYLYEGGIDEYKDYISSTTQLNLIGAPNAPTEWVGQPISLMSLPDGTKDEYIADEGIVIKRLGSVILNGTEEWKHFWTTYSGSNAKKFTCTTYATLYDDVNKVFVISSMFEGISANSANNSKEREGIYAYTGSVTPSQAEINISIDKSRLEIDWDNSTNTQRASAFKAWLSSNNVEVVYYLPETVIIPVVPQPFIARVTAEELQPYQIFANSEPQPEIDYDGEYFQWQTPVTDRTLQDAIRIRDRVNTNAKGQFSVAVWDRLKCNQIVILNLIDYFRSNMPSYIPLFIQTEEGKKAWAEWLGWITNSDMNDIAQNLINLVAGAGFVPVGYTPPKNDYIGGLSGTTPNYQDLNVLERGLLLLWQLVNGAFDMYRYSGEPICGANSEQIDTL